MYQRVVYPILQQVDAERTHDIVLRLFQQVEQISLLRRVVQRLVAVEDPRLHVTAWGLDFNNPLGIAAGLDKNGVAVQTWGALGFGHVEVGTVTPQAQSGNPMPRLFRLPADRALVNRMGFPGQGMAAVRQRLERVGRMRPVVGVNIGANKASVEAGTAVEDYVRGLEYLYSTADYITINISSPNTARLRELQGREALATLVHHIVQRRNAMHPWKPLLVKIAPDLSRAEIDDILAVCLDQSVDGIIATNTTITRPTSLRSTARIENGGLSGVPLRARSTDVIRYVFERTEGRLPIVGVGGVFTVADVVEKLAAGARLVQVYTGFVYGGPLLARRLNKGLVRLLEQHGCRSIAEISQIQVMGKT